MALPTCRVVRWLVNGGIDAIGLSGVDMGLVRVEKYELGGIDLGRVGAVKAVYADKLRPLLEAGLTPVISPISLGIDGLSYNVNADHVAEALAVALAASNLVFITNVPGVIIAGRPLPRPPRRPNRGPHLRAFYHRGDDPQSSGRVGGRSCRRARRPHHRSGALRQRRGNYRGQAIVSRWQATVSALSSPPHLSSLPMNEIIELEQNYLVPAYARAPFVLAGGEGVWLQDTEGRRYLDLTAGIAVNALGYGDPEIAETIRAAASQPLHYSNLYLSEPMVRLAVSLVDATSFADRVHFQNSGAESNEAAIKFARKWAREHYGEGKSDIVAFTGAFHGRTMGALAATPRPKYQDPYRPLMPGVRFAAFNDIDSLAATLDDSVCAVIVEPIQGEGGVHPVTNEFMLALRELTHEHERPPDPGRGAVWGRAYRRFVGV